MSKSKCQKNKLQIPNPKFQINSNVQNSKINLKSKILKFQILIYKS